MTSRYTANGKRRSSMAHAQHPHYFDCGRVCYGNGATMHKRSHGCRELTTTQWIERWPMARGAADKIGEAMG